MKILNKNALLQTWTLLENQFSDLVTTMDISYRAYVLNVNDNINMVIDQVQKLVNEKNLRNVILGKVVHQKSTFPSIFIR